MKKYTLTIVILILFGSFIYAQDTTQITRPAQLTFNYPLGTNGIKSYEVTNNFSLNMLVGLNGGVDGVEIGGLGNINNGQINGAQFGGLFNIGHGDVAGAQFAGNVNFTHGNVGGAQISGLGNITTGNVEGIQAAGILNFNKGDMKHIQLSGLINSNYGNANGLQVAGILNSNLNNNKKDVQLVQISGLVNQNASKMDGAQITSILNISTDTVKGAQIGLINIAKHVEGTQIGLINLCTDDSSNVVPVGMVSFVKGGLFELELGASDFLYANLNYKMGVEKFYTIFKLGYSVSNNGSVYSYGFGLGKYFNLNENNKISLDISSSNLSERLFMATSFDLVNKLDLTFKHSFTENLSFYVGPSFNIYLSEDYGQGETPLITPMYTIAKDSYNRVNTYTWVGANAGISLRF